MISSHAAPPHLPRSLHAKAERHMRLLALLAFVSPQIIAALIDGAAPADLTITGLARALRHSWAEQERQIGRLGA
jgi:site-specific DNA recombinase